MIRNESNVASARRYIWQPGDGTRYEFLVFARNTAAAVLDPHEHGLTLLWLNGRDQKSYDARPAIDFNSEISASELVDAGWREYDASAVCVFLSETFGVRVYDVIGEVERNCRDKK
jgi:hypothetical protein